MQKKCCIEGCDEVIDTKKDVTLCGYDKCVKCCGGCMHRTHYNPGSPEGKKKIAELLAWQQKQLGDFFSKV